MQIGNHCVLGIKTTVAGECQIEMCIRDSLKDGQSITPITPAEKEAEYQNALKDQKEGNIQTAFQ